MGVDYYFKFVDEQYKRVLYLYIGRNIDDSVNDMDMHSLADALYEIDEYIGTLDLSKSFNGVSMNDIYKLMRIYNVLLDLSTITANSLPINTIIFAFWMLANRSDSRWDIVSDIRMSDEVKSYEEKGYDIVIW